MAYAGRQPTTGFRSTPTKDSFNGDNSTVAFTLSIPTRTNDVEVFVENVQQEPVTAYSISGNTLTFTSAPPTGTGNIYVIHRAELVSNGVHTPGADLTATNATITGDLTVTDDAEIGDNATVGGDLSVTGTTTLTGDVAVDTDTLFVDVSENRVGIGTSSPSTPLQVNGTAYVADDHIQLLLDSGNGRLKITDSSNVTNVDIFGSNGQAYFAGDVGIGTSSPDKELEISANDSVALRLTSTDTTLSGNTLLGSFEVYGNEASGAGAGIKSAIQAYTATGDGAGSDLRFFTSAGPTNNTEGMRLDREGNLRFNSGFGSVGTAYGCRAWVNFNGTGTVAIRASGNVSSITDNGTGNYTANFTTAMPDNDYAICATSSANMTTTSGSDGNYGTSAVRFFSLDATGSNIDTGYVFCSIFR